MRSTRQLSITLPYEMADAVKARVETGDYASESEVIREGLRALASREAALEHWLRTEVVDIYDRMKADPARAIPIEEVQGRLGEIRKARAA